MGSPTDFVISALQLIPIISGKGGSGDICPLFATTKPFPVMTFEPTLRQLSFVLPLVYKNAELVFSYKSGEGDDIHVPLDPGRKSRQVISMNGLKSGRWQIRLNWSEGRQTYFEEKDIIIW
jgi:hypothetical protein